MKFMSLAPALAALALLGACATATPYQAAQNSNSGYAEQQIETNRWTVSFSGNSLTDRQTVETYLLYRAAELTSQQGFDHFRVVKRETEADTRYVQTGFNDPFYSNFYCDYAYYSPRGRYYPSRYYPSRFYRGAGYRGGLYGYDDFGFGFDVREIVRYEANAEIIMGSGEKPSDPAYFNAEEVIVNLAGNITRPEVS